MKNGRFVQILLGVILFAVCFLFNTISFGQEIPSPGTIIDKNNIKQYAHFFPPEFLPAFMDGFEGLIAPLKIKVEATTPSLLSKPFIELSEKNKGKYRLDAAGNVIGFDKNGFPFPDVDKSDKDFAAKFMWNFDNKYVNGDDVVDDPKIPPSRTYEKRRGENSLRWSAAYVRSLNFTNRICLSPKPSMSNPLGLMNAGLIVVSAPEGSKNTGLLNYRYIDPKKPDESYMYLPALRRVIRGEAGQRSVPQPGSPTALDDFCGFNGRIPEFTYKFVGEQKVLAVSNGHTFPTQNIAYANKTGVLPFCYDDGWQVKDVYVIEIKSKSPRYPVSLRRVYIDKTSLYSYYSVAFDRAGKLWKVWLVDNRYETLRCTGEKYSSQQGMFGADVQFGIANYFSLYTADEMVNRGHYKYEDFTTSALLMKSRQ